MILLPGPEVLLRFLLCLSAWLLCSSRYCRAEGITRFTQSYVVVNVDGEEVIDKNEEGIVTNFGNCPYVDVFLAGEITGTVSRLVPEDSFLCGSHKAGKYFRIGVGRQEASTLTIPATGEESEIPWYVLGYMSQPFSVTRFTRVRNQQLSSVFDGRRFQTGFQVYYQDQPKYITSGLLMRVSGYAGAENKNAFTVYEDWFRSRYNHNYEICYDYGFVQAAQRGLSAEQGTLHENLSYFALPKQLTDPGGDSRYQFLGWCLSGEGKEYATGQGSDGASFRYGQPAGIGAALVSPAALALAEPTDAAETVSETAAAETANAAVRAAVTATGSEIREKAAAAAKSRQSAPAGLRSTASSLVRR